MSEDLHSLFTELTSKGQALCGFPKEEGVCTAFLAAAQSLREALEGRNVALGPAPTRQLLVKLGRFAGKRQWQMEEIAGQIPTLADVIAEKAESLADPKVTLACLLRHHDMRNLQIAVKLRKELLADSKADLPPDLLFWSSDQKYKFVECRTQRHLKEETAVLKHCVGGDSLDHYLRKMRSGDSRIFSLRNAAGVPCATIEYDTKAKDISQIQGNPRQISAEAPFFPALCETLSAFGKQNELRAIKGLPKGPAGQVLLSSGAWVAAEEVTHAEDILAGSLCVSNATSPDVLEKLCHSPRLKLDVTDLDPSRLPPKILCHLKSDARSFIAPQIESAGNIIILEEAKDVDLSGLKKAGDISAGADMLDLRSLEKAGKIQAGLTKALDLSKLQESGDVCARGVETLDLRNIQKAGNILADSAKTIDLRSLEKAGDIWANSAKTIDLGKLQVAQRIVAHHAQTLDLSKLQKAGNILADRTETLNAPRLEIVEIIKVDAQTLIGAPMLRKGKLFRGDEEVPLSSLVPRVPSAASGVVSLQPCAL